MNQRQLKMTGVDGTMTIVLWLVFAQLIILIRKVKQLKISLTLKEDYLQKTDSLISKDLKSLKIVLLSKLVKLLKSLQEVFLKLHLIVLCVGLRLWVMEFQEIISHASCNLTLTMLWMSLKEWILRMLLTEMPMQFLP